MPVPDYQTLMLPVLSLAAEGETRVPEAATRVADHFALTEEEREELLPSGRQKLLHNRIHWAKFYMTKAGLIDSPGRGRFTASDAGRALLAKRPTTIDVELLRQYPAFLEFYNKSSNSTPADKLPLTKAAASSEATPEEQIDAAHAILHSALKAELLQRIHSQSPAFFERVIVDLLVAMGYGGTHEQAALRLGRSGVAATAVWMVL